RRRGVVIGGMRMRLGRLGVEQALLEPQRLAELDPHAAPGRPVSRVVEPPWVIAGIPGCRELAMRYRLPANARLWNPTYRPAIQSLFSSTFEPSIAPALIHGFSHSSARARASTTSWTDEIVVVLTQL